MNKNQELDIRTQDPKLVQSVRICDPTSIEYRAEMITRTGSKICLGDKESGDKALVITDAVHAKRIIAALQYTVQNNWYKDQLNA